MKEIRTDIDHILEFDWEELPVRSTMSKDPSNMNNIDGRELKELIFDKLCDFEPSFRRLSPDLVFAIKRSIAVSFVMVNSGLEGTKARRYPTMAYFLTHVNFAVSSGSVKAQTPDDDSFIKRLEEIMKEIRQQIITKRDMH